MYTADVKSAETFLKNWGILQANLPICNTCRQEMSQVKIGIGDATVWQCPKQHKDNFDQKNEFILKIKP